MDTDNYEGWTRSQLVKELDRLQGLVDKFGGADGVHKSINERGAGRKPTLTKELLADVKAMRASGETLRSISRSLGISLGLVHKACHLDDTSGLRSEYDPVQISIYELKPDGSIM